MSSATLNTYLNGEYYNGLDTVSQSMIADTKYYLGGNNSLANGAETYYSWERGTTVYNGRSISWLGKIALMYPSDYMYIYALEVSNICFEDGNMCKTNSGGAPTQGWIYNIKNLSNLWLLSPHSQNESRVIFVGGAGELYNGRNDNSASKSYSVLPTLYLEPQIKITSGTGKSDDPYELSL